MLFGSIIVLFMIFTSHNKKVVKDGDGFLTRGEFLSWSSEPIRSHLIHQKAIDQLFYSVFLSLHHHVMGLPSLGKEGTQVGETPSIHQELGISGDEVCPQLSISWRK